MIHPDNRQAIETTRVLIAALRRQLDSTMALLMALREDAALLSAHIDRAAKGEEARRP